MSLKNIKNTFLTNPIITKEVLLKFRHKRFFIISALYALLTFLAIAYILNITNKFAYMGSDIIITRLSKSARSAFMFLSFWQFLIISIITLSFTAASISSEREQNTLSLLLSSQLDSKMIILGKFITSIMYNMVMILVLLPVVSIIFILGGISLSEILLSSTLIFLGTALFAAVAIFFSTLCKKTIMSNILSYLASLSLVLGPVIIPFLILEAMRVKKISSVVYKEIMILSQQLNPLFPLVLLFEKAGVLTGTVFKKYNYKIFMLTSCTLIFLLIILLLVLSAMIFKKKYINSKN